MNQIVTIYDVSGAQQTILKRRAWDEIEITAGLQAGIEKYLANR